MPAKPDTTAATVTPVVPVIEVAPVDHGDAHGVGNTARATIPPDVLHETAEEAQAKGTAFRRG